MSESDIDAKDINAKTETEKKRRGSFVDPTDMPKSLVTPHPPSQAEDIIPGLLREMRDLIKEKNTFLADINTTLQGIEHQLCRMADGKTPVSAPAPAPAPKAPTQAHPIDTTKEIRNLFPSDLETMLTFENPSVDLYVIRTKGFLGSENFAKIASIVRNAGGEYVSAGKDSHFRVKKPKPRSE